MDMKKVWLGGAALLGFIGAAHAADLPRAPYPAKAPAMPAAVAYDWSGFYLGGYYGNTLNQSSAHTPGGIVAGGTAPGTVDLNDGGWTGGGTAGANWQFAPSWLVGIEGDFGYLGGTRRFGEWNDAGAQTAGTKDSWYATARGRFGYVTGPALIYVTGGAGWVHATDTFGTPAAPTQSTTTTAGAAIGGGIEVKLSRNWSTKTEYLYIDGGGNHTFASNSFGTPGTNTVFNHNYQVIKTGLNYRFDGAWDGLPFFNASMMPSPHDWNGFYAGGNAGVGSSMIQTAATPAATAAGFPGSNDINGIGFAGGGQIGYNYILWQKYLLGVEGDFNALAIKHNVTDWNDGGIVFSEKTSWYSTIRGRVGTTTGPALLYITGGVAFVNFQDGAVNTLGSSAFPSAGSITTKTSAGWTFGGGTEVALDAHWTAKLESLYIDAGNSTHATFPAPFNAPVVFKERFTVVRAGLNYSFN
jgi:outer membrane immunogenic protein